LKIFKRLFHACGRKQTLGSRFSQSLAPEQQINPFFWVAESKDRPAAVTYCPGESFYVIVRVSTGVEKNDPHLNQEPSSFSLMLYSA